MYLSHTYGEQDDKLKNYVHRKEDRAKFSRHFILGTKKLDSLYRSIQELSDVKKKSLKEEMIRDIIQNLDTVSFHSSGYKKRFTKQLPNNAFFMSFLLYRSGQNQLDSIFTTKYDGDLLKMVDAFKELHPIQ